MKADNSRVHRLIDLCSCETMILRSDGSLIDLKPLKFYDLKNKDEILMGGWKLKYYADIEDDVIEPSEDLLVEINQANAQTFSSSESEESQDIIPGTEDVLRAFDTVTDEENTENTRLEDVEIPVTQDIYSQDVVTNFSNEVNKLVAKAELMETQSFSDDISNDVKMESPHFKEEHLNIETQPYCRVPPATRNFLKQQNDVKPKTRLLKEFEETQANYENYQLQTQPFVVPKLNSSHSKKLLVKKVEAPNLYARRSASSGSSSTQKMNSILMSSSEDEEDEKESQDNESEEIKIPKNVTQFSETPSNSPLNMDMLLDTPEELPRISSQLLINSDFLERVNCSQPDINEINLEFKAEEEEVVTLTSRTSFKRNAPLLTPEMPKKRFKKKFMKYGSDEDD